jgi:hypothetical protein
MIGTLDSEKKRRWQKHLPYLTHAYNCTKNSVTGYSPYELFFGRKARLPLDLEYGLLNANEGHQTLDAKGFLKRFQAQLHEAFRLASQAEDKQKDRNRKQYNKKAKAMRLMKGDLVLMKNFRRSKIDCQWQEDPYEVVAEVNPQVYKIQLLKDPSVAHTIHRNKLFPARMLKRRRAPTQEDAGVGRIKVLQRQKPEVPREAGIEHSYPPEDEEPRLSPVTRSQTREMRNFKAGVKALQSLAPEYPLQSGQGEAPEKEKEVD